MMFSCTRLLKSLLLPTFIVIGGIAADDLGACPAHEGVKAESAAVVETANMQHAGHEHGAKGHALTAKEGKAGKPDGCCKGLKAGDPNCCKNGGQCGGACKAGMDKAACKMAQAACAGKCGPGGCAQAGGCGMKGCGGGAACAKGACGKSGCSMAKGCKPGCTKPCCKGEKVCKPGCTKPCCKPHGVCPMKGHKCTKDCKHGKCPMKGHQCTEACRKAHENYHGKAKEDSQSMKSIRERIQKLKENRGN